jgi:hypothetical protein
VKVGASVLGLQGAAIDGILGSTPGTKGSDRENRSNALLSKRVEDTRRTWFGEPNVRPYGRPERRGLRLRRIR